MNKHPLQLLASCSLLLTLMSGFALIFGLGITQSYPSSSIITALIISIAYAALMSWTFILNNRNKPWAFKTLALLLAIIFLGLIIKGGALDTAAHANPMVTEQIYFYLQIAYYGTLVSSAVCLNALNFRSNVTIDKATIPWSVNLSGLMMYIIGLTYCTRFSILYYYDIPLYKNSRFVVAFVLTTIALLSLQFFGKYGPLYRSHDGRQAFSTISGYLFLASWIHIFFPLPQFIANYYQYTAEQAHITHLVARSAAIIEVIACTLIFSLMRLRLSKKYYAQFNR